ncbi:MAG: hypothetical protein HKK67_11080 [Chlorobiaceae bacterium]|nr:hypothetical protein [Chlorobiaceae bacterium]
MSEDGAGKGDEGDRSGAGGVRRAVQGGTLCVALADGWAGQGSPLGCANGAECE